MKLTLDKLSLSQKIFSVAGIISASVGYIYYKDHLNMSGGIIILIAIVVFFLLYNTIKMIFNFFILTLIIAGLCIFFKPWQKFQDKPKPYVKYFDVPAEATVPVPAPEEEVSYENITVSRVIDGDVLELENGESVRLIGVDTPEIRANSKAEEDSQRTGQDMSTILAMGQEAKEFTRKLAEGKKVRLEFDAQRKDEYGRLLAYVYVAECKDCNADVPLEHEFVILNATGGGWGDYYTFLNATIIKAGYGQPMIIPPNVKYADLFTKLYQKARENKWGLWKEN